VAGCVESGNVSRTEVLDEVVVGGVWFRGSKPCEGFDGALLEAGGGELGKDALVLVFGDICGDCVDPVVANAGSDPSRVGVFVLVDAYCAVQSNTVVDALEAGIRPALLVPFVFLDELHGSKSTIDFEPVFTIHIIASVLRMKIEYKKCLSSSSIGRTE